MRLAILLALLSSAVCSAQQNVAANNTAAPNVAANNTAVQNVAANNTAAQNVASNNINSKVSMNPVICPELKDCKTCLASDAGCSWCKGLVENPLKSGCKPYKQDCKILAKKCGASGLQTLGAIALSIAVVCALNYT